MRTMISIVIQKSKFRIGNMILRRLLMITCEMFLRYRSRNTIIIGLLGSRRGIFVGIIDALLKLS